MPSQDPQSSSKRRKVDNGAAVGALDDDAVRKHMMHLMASGNGKNATRHSTDDEDQDSEQSDEENESDDESEDESEGGDDSSDASVPDEKVKEEDGLDVKPEPSKSAPTSRINVARIKQEAAVNQSKPSTISSPKADLKRTFIELGLAPQLIVALRTISIRTPTDIQAATFEPMLRGRDVIGCAKTGSGKTMAFALPILQRIARDPFGIFAVVLTPTR